MSTFGRILASLALAVLAAAAIAVLALLCSIKADFPYSYQHCAVMALLAGVFGFLHGWDATNYPPRNKA